MCVCVRPQVHRRKIIHSATFKRLVIYDCSLVRVPAYYVSRDAFTCSEKHKTSCTEPIKSNPFKGSAVSVPPPHTALRPFSSFLNHEGPRDNQIYIFYLPNTNGLEHRVEDGTAD